MTITATGAVRVSELNTECILAASASAVLTNDAFDCLRGSSATPILMSAFYSKTNNDIITATCPSGTFINAIGFSTAVNPPVYGTCNFPSTLSLTLKVFQSNATGSFLISFAGDLFTGHTQTDWWTAVTFVKQSSLGAFSTLTSANADSFSRNLTNNTTDWGYASVPLLTTGTRYIVVFR